MAQVLRQHVIAFGSASTHEADGLQLDPVSARQGIGDYQVTPEELLAEATANFELTFKEVRMGNLSAYLDHDGERYTYIVVSGDGPVDEGCRFPLYDSAEDAVAAWCNAIKSFEGKKFLYWRIRPEIEQDQNKFSIYDDGRPNPTLGKWRVYSRFRVLD